MNLLLAILAFNLIVIIHELGHFITAKLADIKVLEFSLFVGPKLFSIKKGETTYSLRLIPILAYVKMEGEEEHSDSERAFNKKPVLTRFAVIAAGPLANIFTAVILLVILFSVTGYSTSKLSYVEENSPAYNASLREGDIIIKYDGKRVYQPADLIQFLYVYRGKTAEIEYIRNKNKYTTKITPTIIPEQVKYLFGFNVQQISGKLTNIVDGVIPDSPAEKAGLQSGDVVIKLDDAPISAKEDMDEFMSKNNGETVKVTILRNEEEIILEITPFANKIPEQYYLGLISAEKKEIWLT